MRNIHSEVPENGYGYEAEPETLSSIHLYLFRLNQPQKEIPHFLTETKSFHYMKASCSGLLYTMSDLTVIEASMLQLYI